MALTSEGGTEMVMPVAPAYGGGCSNGFGNGFGGDGWWIILLFILLGNNGWSNGFGGYGGGEFPWLINGQQGINANTNSGFRDAMINDGITSIRDGIGNLSTQLCNTGSDIQMSLANGFAGVEQGANARQMANMQTAFAGQTAMTQGFNGLQAQLAQFGKIVDGKSTAEVLAVVDELMSTLAVLNPRLYAGALQKIADL